MKKLVLEVTLRIAQAAHTAIDDNQSIKAQGSWAYSDFWISRNFDESDADEMEKLSDLRMSVEEQMEAAGLPDTEWSLNYFRDEDDY